MHSIPSVTVSLIFGQSICVGLLMLCTVHGYSQAPPLQRGWVNWQLLSMQSWGNHPPMQPLHLDPVAARRLVFYSCCMLTSILPPLGG